MQPSMWDWEVSFRMLSRTDNNNSISRVHRGLIYLSVCVRVLCVCMWFCVGRYSNYPVSMHSFIIAMCSHLCVYLPTTMHANCYWCQTIVCGLKCKWSQDRWSGIRSDSKYWCGRNALPRRSATAPGPSCCHVCIWPVSMTLKVVNVSWYAAYKYFEHE